MVSSPTTSNSQQSYYKQWSAILIQAMVSSPTTSNGQQSYYKQWSAIPLQAMGSNPKQFTCNHSATFPVIFFFRFVCVVNGSSDDVHAIIFIIPDYEYSCLWLIMLYNSCRVYILTSQTVFESEECTKWRLEVSDSSKSRNI